MEAPQSKFEHAIPLAYLERFKQEARIVLPESRVGIWVFPPDWVIKVDANLGKSLEGYSLVAIPNSMLRG